MKYSITKKELAWAVYDFGNSAYALIVMTLFFPLFFAEYIVPEKFVAALWGGSVAISILFAGLIAPVLGAYSDERFIRKEIFIICSVIAIIGTMLLPYSARVPMFVGIVLFIIVNASFALALVFYDSFIITVVSEKRLMTTISSFAWAIGYVGGPVCLGIGYLLMGMHLPADLLDYEILFVTTGLFFLVASMWPYAVLPRDPVRAFEEQGIGAFRTAWQTLKKWRDMKHIFVFLAGMYFIMDGMVTVIYFVSLFAKIELGFSLQQIVVLLLIVQGVAVIATLIMGVLADRFGELKLLIVCSGIWIIIVAMIFALTDYRSFWYVSALTGLVIGATPAIARGYLGKNIPPDKRAELFGFNMLASRIATLFGPLLFGIVASIWGMRVGVLTVIPFFVVGAGFLVVVAIKYQRWQHD